MRSVPAPRRCLTGGMGEGRCTGLRKTSLDVRQEAGQQWMPHGRNQLPAEPHCRLDWLGIIVFTNDQQLGLSSPASSCCKKELKCFSCLLKVALSPKSAGLSCAGWIGSGLCTKLPVFIGKCRFISSSLLTKYEISYSLHVWVPGCSVSAQEQLLQKWRLANWPEAAPYKTSSTSTAQWNGCLQVRREISPLGLLVACNPHCPAAGM